MSRLIDADVFEVVCFQGKSDEFLEGAKYILEMIDAQPTAYNVDAVVAELEQRSFPTHENHSAIWLDTVLEVVRKGGVDG